MASFTTVADSLELFVPAKGTDIDIAISGTYSMTILLQREVGSKGSGAWQTINTYSTANATVAAVYTTLADNENLRLYVSVDTSGTATATLTDNDDKTAHVFRDPIGNPLLELTEEGVVIHGTIHRSSSTRNDSIVSLSASTTITAELHAGKLLVMNVAGGMTATLPAATGTGNRYTFLVGTTFTSSGIIAVASSSDIMAGVDLMVTDTGGITVPTAATSDTLTMNGTTTGGLKGSRIVFEDAASGVFFVSGEIISTGAEATPFSAAV